VSDTGTWLCETRLGARLPLAFPHGLGSQPGHLRDKARVRAVFVGRFGGPEALESRDVPTPEPGDGELLVDVEAIGVNYRDVYEREGGYGGTPPFIAGVEGAGRVRETGLPVAWSNVQGSYAEHIAVPEAHAVPVPDGISTELAAAGLLQGMTAHYLATTTYPVQPGDDVLVHAAAGGVGLLLTQMLKLRGGRVVGTTSSDEKAKLALAAGADEVIGYDEVPEHAFAVVYDGVGQATFERSLAALRPRGMLVLYGAASGPVPPFDPMELERGGSLYLTRPSLRHHATRERAVELFELIAAGKLEVRIGDRYPLEDARKAHEDLESRRTTGKLLLHT
jgi:NADPH:quinone reductase